MRVAHLRRQRSLGWWRKPPKAQRQLLNDCGLNACKASNTHCRCAMVPAPASSYMVRPRQADILVTSGSCRQNYIGVLGLCMPRSC